MGFDYRPWIIHLAWWKSIHRAHTETSSPFLAAQLISINFYSCNAGPKKKCGARRSKLKRPRAPHREFNWSFSPFARLGEDEERQRKTRARRRRRGGIYERRKVIEISKDVYLMGSCVWCYQFLQSHFFSPFNSVSLEEKHRLNRQILITWQSSGAWSSANPFSSGSPQRRKEPCWLI